MSQLKQSWFALPRMRKKKKEEMREAGTRFLALRVNDATACLLLKNSFPSPPLIRLSSRGFFAGTKLLFERKKMFKLWVTYCFGTLGFPSREWQFLGAWPPSWGRFPLRTSFSRMLIYLWAPPDQEDRFLFTTSGLDFQRNTFKVSPLNCACQRETLRMKDAALSHKMRCHSCV